MTGTNAQPPKRRRMVSNQLVRWDAPGQSCTGILGIKELQTLNENEIGRYVLNNVDGTYVINGTIQLDEAMRHVEVGQEIEIEFTGESITSKGRSVKNFDVFVLEDDDTDA